MRRNPLFAKSLSLLVAIAIFATPVVQETGKVLCIGADGHAAVESASGGHCSDVAPAEAAPVPREAEISEEDAHCGSCTDISILVAKDPERRRSGFDMPVPETLGLDAAILTKGPSRVPALIAVGARSLAAVRDSAPALAVVRLI